MILNVRCFCAVAWILLATGSVAHAQFATVINVPPDVAPDAIGSNTQLNVFEGGTIGYGFQAGASDGTSSNVEVNIIEGAVGQRFDAHAGSIVNVSGGVVEFYFNAFAGSVVNISGGQVDNFFYARHGSAVTISGGLVHGRVSAENGSTVNVTGGSVRGDIYAYPNSAVNISGGSVGLANTFVVQNVGLSAQENSSVTISGGSLGGVRVLSGSEVALDGGEFRLDGAPIDGLETAGDTLAFDLPSGSLLTGMLADGTPFAFSDFDRDRIEAGTLTLRNQSLPPVGSALLTASVDSIPLGIRAGQHLVVDSGGVVEKNFSAGRGSSVHVMEGGTVGYNFEAVGANVLISGGSVGIDFNAFSGTTVNISGGSVGHSFRAYADSIVNISGGSVGGDTGDPAFGAMADSTVNVVGGSIDGQFVAFRGSTVNISGGVVGQILNDRIVRLVFASPGSTVSISGGSFVGLTAHSESTVSLGGGEFRLDGVPIGGLETVGDALAFDVPSGSLLTGTLADGTPFAFSDVDGDRFESGAITLHKRSLPSVGPAVLSALADPLPLGIRAGQRLVVESGGVVGNNFNAGRGSTVHVKEGGTVGYNFEAVGASVDISGGSVGSDFDAFSGSIININGGLIGTSFQAHSGSIVNLFGTEFLVDGVPVEGLAFGEPFLLTQRSGVLRGLFADGAAFAFSLTYGTNGGRSGFSPDALITLTVVPEPSSAMLVGVALLSLVLAGTRSLSRIAKSEWRYRSVTLSVRASTFLASATTCALLAASASAGIVQGNDPIGTDDSSTDATNGAPAHLDGTNVGQPGFTFVTDGRSTLAEFRAIVHAKRGVNELIDYRRFDYYLAFWRLSDYFSGVVHPQMAVPIGLPKDVNYIQQGGMSDWRPSVPFGNSGLEGEPTYDCQWDLTGNPRLDQPLDAGEWVVTIQSHSDPGAYGFFRISYSTTPGGPPPVYSSFDVPREYLFGQDPNNVLLPWAMYFSQILTPPDPSLPGDMDGDGDVDRQDAMLFGRVLGAESNPPGGPGDFDGDGLIGLADLAMLQAYLGQTLPDSAFSSATVPEPSSVLLLVGAFLIPVPTAALRSTFGSRHTQSLDLAHRVFRLRRFVAEWRRSACLGGNHAA